MAREVKCKKAYVSDSETEGKQSYFEGATTLEFRFANDVTESVDPMQLSDKIRTAAMFHGLSQKLGDAYASAKDPDEAYEKFMALKERIDAGEWLGERESAGPRTSLVVKAIVAAKQKAGVEVSEADVASKFNELSKEQRKTVLDDPRVKAEYDRIRAEAAAERAAKSAEAAASTTGAEFAI